MPALMNKWICALMAVPWLYWTRTKKKANKHIKKNNNHIKQQTKESLRVEKIYAICRLSVVASPCYNPHPHSS